MGENLGNKNMAEGGACAVLDDYMKCEKHPDTKVEIYCEQHVVVCCLACAWKDHHECRPKPCMLEEAKQSFQDEQVGLIDQLMTCSETCDEGVDALTKQIELLEDTETSVRTKFTKVKAEMIVKLDDMEQQLTDDIDEFICDKTKKLTESLAQLTQQKQDIDETKQTIQNLLQTSDPGIVAAFVKLKRLIKSVHSHSRADVRIPTFNVSKEVRNFLNCSAIGSFRSSGDNYENVELSTDVSKEEGAKVNEDDETLMSDILPEDKETKSPPKQERSGITFGKIFRLFKFRGSSQPSAKSSPPTANPNPLPLAASGNIEDEEWYHGDITRDVANARLLGNGDYLLRAKPNSITGGSDYVLSVCSKIQHHAFIKSVKGGWKFKGRRFSTIEDLIKHLHHTMAPLISASHKVVLQSPVPSKPLSEAEGTAAEKVKRERSCFDDDDGYEDVFETGERILKEESKQKVVDEVIANFDFDANDKDELSFQKGEQLKILYKEATDWWKARNKKGQVGLIPQNYVTKITEQQTIPEPEDSTEEEDDSNSPYEPWAPPPSACPEYEFCCDISEIGWFHGCLPRENAEKRLTSDGDFLVREHRGESGKQYILSVFWGVPRHFRYKKTLYDQPHNPVQYYIGTEVPIKQTIDVKLRNPILKESWELRNDDIILKEKLTRGIYGDIHKGILQLPRALQVPRRVTLHVAREDMTEDGKKLFLGAAQILHEINHSNIVKCLGIAMDYEPVIVVTEYMAGGSLLSYLRGTSSITVRRKTEICNDVAEALVYLQDRKCIHRDVAARRCQITGEGTVKLSDFEMSSRLDSLHSASYKFLVPVKWTAPEVLRSEDFQRDYRTLYCLKSDIWSFGILVWEVFSQGKVPYSGLRNAEAAAKILEGYRIPPPEGTPQFIAELITRCWNDDPDRRPNIKHIVHWLKAALKSTTPETFVLPPLPPPLSTRPVPRNRTADGKKTSSQPVGESSQQKLKEQMRNRPLPPTPPIDSDESEHDQNSAGSPTNDAQKVKPQRRPPPPPPSRGLPPLLPLDTDDEEEEYIEPT